MYFDPYPFQPRNWGHLTRKGVANYLEPRNPQGDFVSDPRVLLLNQPLLAGLNVTFRLPLDEFSCGLMQKRGKYMVPRERSGELGILRSVSVCTRWMRYRRSVCCISNHYTRQEIRYSFLSCCMQERMGFTMIYPNSF